MKKYQKFHVAQKDQTDCGIACLATVVRYFSGEVSLEQLRNSSGTNIEGTSLLGLHEAAQRIGLQATAYEATMEQLKVAIAPAILHTFVEGRFYHYVVCFGFRADKKVFIISDPAQGVKEYSEAEVAAIWQSGALLLIEGIQADFQKKTHIQHRKWQWIKTLLQEDMNVLVMALVLGICIAALSLSTAIFSQQLIDVILPAQQSGKLIAGILMLLFLLWMKGGLAYLRQLFLLRQSKVFNIRLIRFFYGSLLRLPKTFFDTRKTGELIARMNDTRRIQQVIVNLFSNVMIDVILITVSAIAIFSYSTFIGVMALIWLPLFGGITYFFHHRIIQNQQRVMIDYAHNEAHYVDTIQGIGAIKISNQEASFTQQTQQVYTAFQQSIFQLGKVSIHFQLVTEWSGALFMVGIIGYSSMGVLQQVLTLGALMAILQMVGIIMPAASRLAMVNIQLQEATIAFNRMFEFTSLKPEYPAEASQEDISSFQQLSIQNLAFRFAGQRLLLKDISLTVQKGQIIALLGESGCGKTTLLQILQKFYPIRMGEMLVNNIEWNDLNIPAWRNIIGVVPQQIKVFNGSLLANITPGVALDQQQISEMVIFCKKYGFDKYFSRLPNGYRTIVGEQGINLSGGQQQLLGLARALYRQPQLLLLDEATAAMDRHTETFVLNLLHVLKQEMGIIFSTHRLKSARHADCIYIIEDGMIQSQGQHQQLISGENIYAEMWVDVNI